MKKIILILNLLVAATSAKAQNVYALGFWKPDSSVWVSGFPGNISPYISPATANLYSGGPSATFKAVALDSNAGWKVEAWYLTHSLSAVSAGDIISGSEGRNELEWKYDGQVVQDCLSVKYAYITYAVKYAGDGNGIPSGTSSVGYTNEFLLAAAPTRTGWTFAGWQDGSGKLHQSGDKVSGASFAELARVHDDKYTVTLTAQWNEKEYAIGTSAEHCTVSVAPVASYTNDVTISWTPDTSEIGHLLKCKSVQVCDETGKVIRDYGVPSGTSVSFKMSAQSAYWEKVIVKVVYEDVVNSYTITFDPNGGSGAMASVLATCGEAYQLPKCDFTNGSYPFAGWNTRSDGKGMSYLDEGTVTQSSTAGLTLYAQWDTTGYALKIYPCGGIYEGEMAPVEHRDFYPLIPRGTNYNQIGISVSTNGAAFLGYYSDRNGSGFMVYDQSGKYVAGNGFWTADGKYNRNGDMSVYAFWGPPPGNFEVAFVAEPFEAGEIRVDYDGRQVTSNDFALTVIEGSNFVMTATATNSGYSFSCWTNSLGFTTNDNPWTYAAPSVVTNVALFTGNVYKVTFLAVDVMYQTQVNYTYGKPYGTLPAVDREGWKLNGWYDVLGNRIDASDIMRTVGDTSIYLAQWNKLSTYTIAFDGNGANSDSISMADQIAYCETPTALHSNTYEKTGYAFLGWVTNKADAVKMQPDFVDGATVTDLAEPNETATLYAVWSNNVYTVDFDANGGTGTMPSQEFTYDVTNDLNKCEFGPPAGMEFVGWSNDVLKVVYTNGQPVANLCTGAAGDDRITLTAVWSLPDVGDYSRAMHCTTLEWKPTRLYSEVYWHCREGENVGYAGESGPSGSEVFGMPSSSGETDYLAATVQTAGTLTFRFRMNRRNGPTISLCKWNGSDWEVLPDCVWKNEFPGDEYGDLVTVESVPAGKIAFFVEGIVTDVVGIDQVTWTPDSPVPTPDEPVAIESASVAGGLFRLGVLGEKGVDYGVWTNADLTVPAENWGFMTNQVGVGAPFEFELKILPNEPKLFYRAYKVK